MLGIAGAVQAADDSSSWYRAGELSVGAFGTGSIGQQTIDHLSGSRVSNDVRLGAGAEVNYFFTRYFGIGADAYTENTDHFWVDSASANLIGRIPIGDSGLAPYAFAGAGHQFDNTEQWFGQIGAGIEIRFHENWSIFTDARYVFADKTENYGVGRLGVRFIF
jgi:outer membrane protein W